MSQTLLVTMDTDNTIASCNMIYDMHVRYIHAIEACVARYSRHYSLTMLCFFSPNVSTTLRRSSSVAIVLKTSIVWLKEKTSFL